MWFEIESDFCASYITTLLYNLPFVNLHVPIVTAPLEFEYLFLLIHSQLLLLD